MTFYDYKTGPVTDKILFDTTKTGMSFYDDILHKPNYMEKHNNLKGEIVMMTPTEYFQGCADIFGSTYDRQVSYTKSDTPTINHLVRVINEKKVKFPIGFLNFAEGSQEGRHRMFVAGMLSGWQTEQPVLVINWADEERHKREEQLKKEATVGKKIDTAIREVVLYRYRNLDELEVQVQYELNRAFSYDILKDIPMQFSENSANEEFEVTVNGVTRTIPYEDIRWEDYDDDFDIDWDSIDLDMDPDELINHLDEVLNEDIEKHQELNPILFKDNKLRPEVRSSIMNIVSQYLEDSQFLTMEDVIDVEIVGSNASYNYTKDSDLDIHIVIDMENVSTDPGLVQVACNAEKSVFNSKYDFTLSGIDVELYVEDVKASTASNGVYSVTDNGWVKYPIETSVPDMSNNTEFHELLKDWTQRANRALQSNSAEKITEFIGDIYNLRRLSIMKDGEYALGNLVFKEIRNEGLLDQLKDKKSELISKDYSL